MILSSRSWRKKIKKSAAFYLWKCVFANITTVVFYCKISKRKRKSSEYHVKIVCYDFTQVLKYKQIEIAECKDLMAKSLHDAKMSGQPCTYHTHAKITICLGRDRMADTCSILRVNNRVRWYGNLGFTSCKIIKIIQSLLN